MPRDPRMFITVHDGMPEHPKIEGLSDAAFRLLMTSWCWCARQLTDGHIKASVWGRRSTQDARDELIDAGLVEVAEDGVMMHDYTEHQRTAAEVAELREKRSEAGRRGGLAKAGKPVASAIALAKQVAKQNPSKPLAETEVEREIKDRERASKKSGTTVDPAWLPDPEVRQQIGSELPHVDLKAEHAKFVDHFTANGKTMKDWTAAWRNWMRRSSEFSGGRPASKQDLPPAYEATPAPDPESLPW